MISPYWDNNFWQFFVTLGQRLFSLNGGLASDELQILVLGSIAISCGLLGPFLVLRKMTMLANSLSHTVLLGLVVSFLLGGGGIEGLKLPYLLAGAMVAALLTAISTSALTRFFRLSEDASIGLVFTALFALGIVAVTLFTKDVHLGVEAIMGNADALLPQDLSSAFFLALINAGLVFLFFFPLQFTTFDRASASSSGLPCGLFQALLLFLTAATSIAAFRAIGVLLVLSFLVGPYLTARLFCNRLGRLLFLTPAIGIMASLIGVALARHLLTEYSLALSTGGIVSVLIALFYVTARVFKALFKISASSQGAHPMP